MIESKKKRSQDETEERAKRKPKLDSEKVKDLTLQKGEGVKGGATLKDSNGCYETETM